MFVKEININEFRGIHSCKEPIPLSNFTVLIGRNNSGKSTILEALSLLPHPGVKNYFSIGNQENKIQLLLKLHRKDAKNYTPLIYLYSGASTIEYTIEEPSVNIADHIFKFTINEKNYDTYVGDEQDVEANVIRKRIHTESDDLPNLVIYLPNDTTFITKLEDKMKKLSKFIMKEGIHQRVVKYLNNCVDDKYTEIAFFTPIQLRKEFPNRPPDYIDLRDLGSGAEKAVKIMTLIEAIKPKLLLIDDFEAGYHPSLTKMVLDWLKEKNWQTVIATHSIDVLEALLDVKPADMTLLQLYKSESDELKFKRLTLEDLEDIIDANSDPRFLVDALGL